MSFNFKSISRKNPLSPGDPPKFYASPVYKDKIDLRTISGEIAKMTTVSRADSLATLQALGEVLSFFLTSGNIVYLGDFGTFRISLKCTGAATEPELTSSNIASYHLLFRPGIEIAEKIRNMKAEKKATLLK